MASSPPPEADLAISSGGTAHWLAALPPPAPAAELGVLQLAWLGDAVWELHQRLRHSHSAGRAADLHRAVVSQVQAQAQAAALRRLEPLLTSQERDLVRRGRNRAGRGPRPGEAATYGQATGFETMLGWLFLRNPQRLAELLDHLDESAPLPLASSP